MILLPTDTWLFSALTGTLTSHLGGVLPGPRQVTDFRLGSVYQADSTSKKPPTILLMHVHL